MKYLKYPTIVCIKILNIDYFHLYNNNNKLNNQSLTYDCWLIIYQYCISFSVYQDYSGFYCLVWCDPRALNCVPDHAQLPSQQFLLLRCSHMHTRACHHRDAFLSRHNWVRLLLLLLLLYTTVCHYTAVINICH